MKSDKKIEFDFTAVKIFFSVIAIFLSATTPNTLALTESSSPFQSSDLNTIISDFVIQKAEPIQHVNEGKYHCDPQNKNSASKKSPDQFVNFGSDFTCLRSGSNMDPNDS